MKVYMITSEAAPFAKSGGLGDVLGALPKALAEKGADCRVVLPLYSTIPQRFKDEMTFLQYLYIKLDWRNQYCGIFQYEREGVIYYFIDNEYYFNTPTLYCWNDMERFCFFQKAALEILQYVDFCPDVIHCHDWQAGMVPILLDAQFKRGRFYENIKTVMTIHNLRYQGRYNVKDVMAMLELPAYYFTEDKAEYYGDANFLKAGIVYADFVTTVSDTYAQEIQSLYYGEGLDGLLFAKSNRLGGVLNGIDYDVYAPMKDDMIYAPYGLRDFVSGKQKNKAALQEQLGLEVRKDVPMIGVVSRLVGQKGFDLVNHVLDRLSGLDLQLVVLGTGEERYERALQDAAWLNPTKISANITFSEELAHKIYAASDLFLMPSLFEPCGLGQMIAMSYGSLPIVREVGGLKDTVIPYNEFTGEGNGFSFSAYNAHDMLYTIERALGFYRDKRRWNSIVRNAMKSRFTWDKAAQDYLNIYQGL